MDIMQAILDIEQKAQGIIDSADVLKEQQKQEIEAEIEKLRQKSDAAAKAQISQYVQRTDAERKEQTEKLEEAYRKRLSALDAVCSEKKQGWIDEITKRILAE